MENKKIVLAIDDNAMMLEMFEKMLSPDYDVRTVNSATNALQYLNANHSDVILLDIMMPNISGFDFLYDIREIPSYMNVPIIIVSGNTGEDFFNQARSSSAFDVLTKPVKKETLVATIEKALGIKS
jgi:CheY-like chemotaxis protein